MDQDKNKIDDDHLSALLRDVKVPRNLKEQLNEIPELASPGTSVAATDIAPSRQPIVAFILAASILAVAAFFAWPLLSSSSNPGTAQKDNGTKVDSNIDPTTDNPANGSSHVHAGVTPPVTELVKLSAHQNQLEESIHEIEMNRLRAKLSNIQSNTPSFAMQRREYDSLVTAVADQTIIQLGGSQESVRSDMVQVLKNYPNTRGAKIAQDFLNSTTN